MKKQIDETKKQELENLLRNERCVIAWQTMLIMKELEKILKEKAP